MNVAPIPAKVKLDNTNVKKERKNNILHTSEVDLQYCVTLGINHTNCLKQSC